MERFSKDFLQAPATNITVEKIKFADNLQDYSDCYAVVLDNVLSPEECDILIAAAEEQSAGTWDRAMINIGGGIQAMDEDTRKCGRIIWDSQDLAARIWKRVEGSVPEILRLENNPHVTGWVNSKEVWNMTRLNEKIRFLKYQGGEYFRPHCDGCYMTSDGQERSYFTLHLYLNTEASQAEDSMAAALKGGSTPFFAYNMKDRLDVVPRAGRVLIFQQRNLIHSGDDVVCGVKYTMRTDIMFAQEDSCG